MAATGTVISTITLSRICRKRRNPPGRRLDRGRGAALGLAADGLVPALGGLGEVGRPVDRGAVCCSRRGAGTAGRAGDSGRVADAAGDADRAEPDRNSDRADPDGDPNWADPDGDPACADPAEDLDRVDLPGGRAGLMGAADSGSQDGTS